LKGSIKEIINRLKIIPGFKKSINVIPEALKAVISLSEDNLPNAISVVIRIAIGTANENIHAEFNRINFKTTPIDIPFPRNLSRFLRRKFESKTITITINEPKKGVASSFRIYLFIIFNIVKYYYN